MPDATSIGRQKSENVDLLQVLGDPQFTNLGSTEVPLTNLRRAFGPAWGNGGMVEHR